jgi:Transcription factor Pcc1
MDDLRAVDHQPFQVYEGSRSATGAPAGQRYHSNLRIAFPTDRDAHIAMNALLVDDELQPERVTKEMFVDGNDLVV